MTHGTKGVKVFNGESITAGQRRAIFAAGKARGLDLDALRELTPSNSISAMSRSQAGALLERLNGTDNHCDARIGRHDRHRRPRRPKGVIGMVSTAQRAKIDSLRIDMGWTVEGLAGFLAERHFSHGGPMSRMLTSVDGIEVIELLKQVLQKQRAADRKQSTRRLVEG